MPEDTDQTQPTDPLTVGELISLKEAAELSDLSPVFLSQLAKKGRLEAKKIGRDWFTTKTAVEIYKRTRHRGKRTDLDKPHLNV